ncbi:serine hydroxymethyltransferase [Dehalococcoidales bacterium]|nr:serine hydroxymethyltransferase [Dehalococcoidales bacterium]MCL0053325.1 serine hydroxymethyltransferase [Dehalococcoidales bacterium]MCL0057553.1 serine hydroxymethyltransferase [Dehalococcoidales bacterium]MCL0094645.1 serine hydroxymethyltransferase [Dehalococcoidales bacterium]
MSFLSQTDPEISRAISMEENRQRQTINLIASENYASRAVLEAGGSLLTNKYAEGYPQQRYYGGCKNVDIVEGLAIQRAKELFYAEHANVQVHSGAQANMAAYYALLEYGDTVMGMSLAHGGHLTHGDRVNFSGKSYNFIAYGVNKETERIDYQEVKRLALKHKPKLIVAGASAYPRIIDFERFRQIADLVGAKLMADIAHIAGLVAVGLHPTPVPYAEVVTSTTHKTLRGPRSGFILCRRELAPSIDAAVFPRMQGGPLMHVIAAKAVCFYQAMQPGFLDYQRATLENALTLATELKQQGLRLISGGTDNHLVLVDLTETGVSGREAEECLEAAGIVVNRNAIPFDPRPPLITSGIRLGTPAVTSRGFGKEEMKRIASLMVKVISNIGDRKIQNQVKEEVSQLCQRFPLPGIDD